MQITETLLAARSNIAARSPMDSEPQSENTMTLMIVLFALFFMGILMAAVMLLLRRIRLQQQMRAEGLPQYHQVAGKRDPNHRRLTIQTTPVGDGRHSVLVFRDGQPMLANPQSPPHSPDNVPQIHITFPDEHDESGRPRSGRVMLVRVGENAVGMEPLQDDEQLPAYQKENPSQFYSIDIEKIGGLKEKDQTFR